MTDGVEPDRSLRCLTLSTYAQAIIERLVQPPGERLDDLSELIKHTVVALEEVKEKGWPTSTVSGLQPFRYYDQVKILSHVSDESAAQDQVNEVLNALCENPNTEDKQVIDVALRFFRALAKEALRQSRFSDDEAAVADLRA